MLSEKTNSLIGEFLLRVARTEKKLEVIRQMLCEFPEFEPYSAFQRLDLSHSNLLSSQDLFSFLQNNQQSSFTEDQIRKTFLNHYDYDGDGFLCYSEFLKAILPADQPVLRTMVSQRPIYTVEEAMLDDEIEYTLTKLLTEEILSYFDLEEIKAQITSKTDFSYENLLDQIDYNNLGYIDFNNLFEFFRNNAFYPYEEEIIAVLRRLDKNEDGRLALPEIIEAFEIKSLKKRPSKQDSSQKKPEINPKSQRKTSQDYNPLQKKSSLQETSQKTFVKAEKTIEEQLQALNDRILSDKKTSFYKKEDPTERKSRIKEPILGLTEKKSEIPKKFSLNQEIINRNEPKLEESSTFEENPPKKSNIGYTYTNTPPKYPRNSANKGLSGQLSERTPPHYSLYPYEPVRRAFSPMKDQSLINSKTPPKKPISYRNEEVSSNSKRMSFKPIEDDLDTNRLDYNEKARLSLYQKEIPFVDSKKASLTQGRKSIIKEEERNSLGKGDSQEKLFINQEERRFSQKKSSLYESSLPLKGKKPIIKEEQRNSTGKGDIHKNLIRKSNLQEETFNNQEESRFSQNKGLFYENSVPGKMAIFKEEQTNSSLSKRDSQLQQGKKSFIKEQNRNSALGKEKNFVNNQEDYKLSQKNEPFYESRPQRQSFYQEKNPMKNDTEEENEEIYEETYIKHDEESYHKRPYSNEKRLSHQQKIEYYQEKPLIPSEDKRSSQNEEKVYFQIPQRESLLQKNETFSYKKSSQLQNQENPQFSYSNGEKPAKDSIHKEKPLVFSEDKRTSIKNNEKIPICNEKRASNVVNSEKSVDSLQEKARLQSIKIDEILKNEKNLKNDKKMGYRGSDLGFYSKNEFSIPLKKNERKSAPLILAQNSFNSIKNEENNDSGAIYSKKPKQRIISANLQVKEEINEEDEELPVKKSYNNEENGVKSGEILLDIVKYFKTLINCEDELEKCKQNLALRPDFNLVDFFLFFDKEKLGCCVKEEFGETLKELGVHFQKDDLELFLKRFAKNEETLKFYDFSEAFLPILDDYADLLNQRKPINIDFQFKYRELFSPETRRLIAENIKTHLENEGCLESIREAICRKDQAINWEMFFDSFDLNKDGFISDDEFRDFMEEKDLIFAQKELEMVYERVDLDKDGRISLEEFRKELEPRLEYSI